MLIKRLVFAGLIVIAFAVAGCGYSATSALPSGLRTVYVEDFKNSIAFTLEGERNLYLPLLEVKARNAIIQRFQFDGHLRIAQPETADLILKGELIGYERAALRYTDNDDVQEYRVRVVVKLTMWDTKLNQPFWVESGFAGEGDYFVRGPVIGTESAALEEAIVDLARRVVERTIENW